MNYLSNKDILAEIIKSKNSFSEYIDDKYKLYDVAVCDIDFCLKPETIKLAKEARLKRIADELKVKKSTLSIDDIQDEDLVFRVMTFDHIPEDLGRKKNPKRESERRVKLNFPPYKHYIINNGELVEVGRSHCLNGEFSKTHGIITNKLAHMFILLVERIAQKSGWRGYSYLDEMKGQALVQLSQLGLMFNEAKSDNPFAYYTTCVDRSFMRVLKIEKTNQQIRDQILLDNGFNPSFTKQLEIEENIRRMREESQNEIFEKDE